MKERGCGSRTRSSSRTSPCSACAWPPTSSRPTGSGPSRCSTRTGAPPHASDGCIPRPRPRPTPSGPSSTASKPGSTRWRNRTRTAPGRRRKSAVWPERIDAIEAAVEARALYSPEVRALAGCIVSIGEDGAMAVIRGLVRPEDVPAAPGGSGERGGAARYGRTSGRREPGARRPAGPAHQRPGPHAAPRRPRGEARKAAGVGIGLADDPARHPHRAREGPSRLPLRGRLRPPALPLDPQRLRDRVRRRRPRHHRAPEPRTPPRRGPTTRRSPRSTPGRRISRWTASGSRWSGWTSPRARRSQSSAR